MLLESAGRPDAMAGGTEGAVGLTQILAETGANLLDMRVDVAASRRLTKQIGRALSRGDGAKALRLAAERRRVDERYDPPKALAATVRYLDFAKGELDGRDDMAVASYHMGVGNLQGVLDAFGAEDDTPYAEVFFDSSPLAPRGGVGQARRAGRRLLDVPVARPRRHGDHAAAPRGPRASSPS